MPEDGVNINLRLPRTLRDRVDAHARRDHRDRTHEIHALLEEAMDAREDNDR